jgi:hypothetical protein
MINASLMQAWLGKGSETKSNGFSDKIIPHQVIMHARLTFDERQPNEAHRANNPQSGI